MCSSDLFAWVEQRASSVGVVALDLPPTDVVADMVISAAEADDAVAKVAPPPGLAQLAAKVQRGLDTALAPDGRWRYYAPGSDVVTGLEDGTTRVVCSVTIGRTTQVFARDGEYLVH